jgi:hypothetical protein
MVLLLVVVVIMIPTWYSNFDYSIFLGLNIERIW